MSTPSSSRQSVVTADMVASVIAVHVEVGDEVAEGEALLVVESMKMEIPITAPVDGVVAQIGVAVGDIVQEGDLLVAIDR